MKKFLSLVLALVMTMSLVTVSAGAKDFTDNSKINYEEAVEVMSTLGVVGGYTDGSFKPQGTLTRGAAAKIICNLILGTTTADALTADGHLVALGDEPGDVGLAGVVGDPAHGYPLLLRLGVLAVIAGGEGQIQLFGGQLGIVGEHFIEVPQAEKQNGIRVILLDFQILLHHGGQFRHKNTSFFIFQQMFLFYFTKSYTRVPLCGTGKHGDTMQN